jgi:2-iminobutanoate/2-iminopropanoate deaminase
MPKSREVFTAPGAPKAVGPYSHAIRTGDLLFCSGQVALDPETGELVGDTPAEQTARCLSNLEAVCSAADCKLVDAVRCTVYLTDLSASPDVNEVYARFFGEGPPARVAFGVAALPLGAQVEIDAVVAL